MITSIDTKTILREKFDPKNAREGKLFTILGGIAEFELARKRPNTPRCPHPPRPRAGFFSGAIYDLGLLFYQESEGSVEGNGEFGSILN